MIIVKLIGGLGNQLFQYAAGRTLAYINNTELKLDVTGFSENKLRNFELFNFNIDAEFAKIEEINSLLPAHNFEKAFQYISPARRKSYYRERQFRFDKRVLKLGNRVYLKGYFQSENYFFPAKELIRKELSLKPAITDHLSDTAAFLQHQPSVSVHIRRGDMSADSLTNQYHGLVPVSYYKEAISRMKEYHGSPVFYIFSDDIAWARENLPLENAVYASGELSKNHLEDFYLMSRCRHHIIANSSFSWWAAWLNDYPDKKVIAPKNWFNKGPKDTQDLIPQGWLRI